MLWVDGVVPDIERLIFDGHTCAGVAIDLTSEFNGISPAHIHELAIQNLKQVGIVGGRPELATYERHDVNGIVSEVSINQVSFKHIDYAGIAVLTPNALDYWIRDSYFEDCAIGITNAAAGAGWAYSYDEHIPGLPYLAPLPWGEKPVQANLTYRIASSKTRAFRTSWGTLVASECATTIHRVRPAHSFSPMQAFNQTHLYNPTYKATRL